MMAPHAPRLAATILVAVILGSLALTVSAWAAGPVFESPTDGARVRGVVTLKAAKSHLDGNSSGYIAFRIAREGADLSKAPYAAALVSPFEFTWDTQETYLNEKDSWDPLNGSRRYGDGRWILTAAAFDAAGRPLGEPTTITVTIANRLTGPVTDPNGRVRLRAGGREGEELRYRAEGSLLAELDQDEVAKLTDPTPPPRVELRMGASWRDTIRKAMGPAHTADGRRWHAQLDDGVTSVAPDGRALSLDWRALSYGVRDEHIESGFCELLGMTYHELYDQWRAGSMNLGGLDEDITGARGTAAADAARAAGPSDEQGAMRGAERGVRGFLTGNQPWSGRGMAQAAGQGALQGMAQAQQQRDSAAASAASSVGGSRLTFMMPVNLAGIGRRYRSVVRENNAVDKLYRDDPRWPLAELWTPLPNRPVKVGDAWSGGMTIMPFFDQDFHLYVPSGTAATGPHHMDPLYNRYYVGQGADSVNEGHGPGFAAPVHVLDGFELYKGYQCARIVSKFRNYANREDWTRTHKTGWWLSDLRSRIFGSGQSEAGNADGIPIVRTDLTRVTYFDYRTGHIVGIEDHYQHKLWLNKSGFISLASTRQPTREREQSTDLTTLASTLGLPTPATTGATPATAGQGGAAGGGMMGGPGGGGGMMGGAGGGGGMMGGPGGGGMMGGGMMGGAGAGGGMPGMGAGAGGGAAATNRNGWAIGDQWTLFGAPQGGGGAAAGGGAGGMMGGPGGGGGMMGGGAGMMGGPGGGAGRGAGAPGGGMMGGGPGGGGGMMGGGAPGGGMPGMGGAGAAGGTADESMANAWAHVIIRIMEESQGRGLPASGGVQYAALPPTGASATIAPTSSAASSAVRRYIVVEDTGTFYLAGSALAKGKHGIELSISADQLMGLGFTPAPDLKF